jgi:hypothetical protein
MLETVSGWDLDVEQNTQWLFVKLKGPNEAAAGTGALAQRLGAILQERSIRGLVLELDEITKVDRRLVTEVILLHRRIGRDGGLLRLSGLSSGNRDILDLYMAHLRFRFSHLFEP